jgi:predicted nucleic acid-binding protein
MGKQYLIDSNALIDYLAGKLPENGKKFMDEIVDEIPNISVITKIEVLGFKTTNKAEELLNGFMDDSIIIGLTDEIVEQTIKIRKEHKIKLPDAIIAASALINQMLIITRNIKDFEKIENLKVVNPHTL